MLGRGSHLGTWCFGLGDKLGRAWDPWPGWPRSSPLLHESLVHPFFIQVHGTDTPRIRPQKGCRSPYEATFQGETQTALGLAAGNSSSQPIQAQNHRQF